MDKKILILDDNADILDMLSILLIDSGYQVHALSSGEKVFEIIKKFHPDLVLMDVMLANMDGRVICREIKTNTETDSIPVILISGTHDLAKSLNQQGAPNDFIAKPFDIQNLLAKIERQLVD
ncbi:Response regulator receiver domain-containing protein [Mucilaginibacter lappiensis]|uniref:DNA-binding response OmpR family regulator n=1 Tax=Mucilaginibacter lappiensis TaxID=354630 RepID=A0ABR6PCX9_9SPHI|nr:response regulator [Mucilaginibacter lappiensis]MBB6107602.1 DNA-binding response OmpR family regulator [Mucilaginibacter lappiensis]SIQ03161.1 Response regulator receiver domain-containing protein [Mucilaginibacter lappiensis]